MKEARYAHDGPPSITLFTVVSNRNGSGAHSALLINADERVLFDPAGSFALPFAPERNDVHFGMTERAVAVYIDYHARETFNILVQKVALSDRQAQIAIDLVKTYGAVPRAQCGWSVSRILQDVPGFSDMRATFLPNSISRQFTDITGVEPDVITDTDADKNHNVLFQVDQDAPGG